MRSPIVFTSMLAIAAAFSAACEPAKPEPPKPPASPTPVVAASPSPVASPTGSPKVSGTPEVKKETGNVNKDVKPAETPKAK